VRFRGDEKRERVVKVGLYEEQENKKSDQKPCEGNENLTCQ